MKTRRISAGLIERFESLASAFLVLAWWAVMFFIIVVTMIMMTVVMVTACKPDTYKYK